jgi:hypothetical protein
MDCDHWAEGAHCLMASVPKRQRAPMSSVYRKRAHGILDGIRYGLVKVSGNDLKDD